MVTLDLLVFSSSILWNHQVHVGFLTPILNLEIFSAVFQKSQSELWSERQALWTILYETKDLKINSFLTKGWASYTMEEDEEQREPICLKLVSSLLSLKTPGLFLFVFFLSVYRLGAVPRDQLSIPSISLPLLPQNGLGFILPDHISFKQQRQQHFINWQLWQQNKPMLNITQKISCFHA